MDVLALALTGIFGLATVIFGIFAVVLGRRQGEILSGQAKALSNQTEVLEGQSGALDALAEIAEESQEILRRLAEAKADLEEAIESSVPESGDDSQESEPSPVNAATFIKLIQDAGGHLDVAKARWTRKRRCEDTRGNFGWFAEDPTNDSERWFARSGRSVKVRPALPRKYLEAWKKETGLPSCEIELDYRVGSGRGNHPWYVRTYDGQTWKVSFGGAGKAEATVTLLDAEDA